ncbi:MAG: Gfo/Idh/MocA family oxidoreductase [Candidatus Marinimicrobia bacterium]|jgi:predicted dehydrogenase|nr:Gfo/Idh/MocA family oxidoreductase [Flavobacteriaceae bacterium]MBT3738289.1 Gfo/Idh/MocA family oxidoreductase [Candidatus Neomarinimicrobiota bacterium]MBT4113014.1 Gfo/Idh/MocA family oxidoreductase [Flavobacteriaceae bacterium]MBT4613807.1 Gfo/Idh/MocA family oxidoreductase [Flavobacteriaceae bacterium]MBT5649845.1 Gfo/Idh/MocA family oxidoreductase [Flavobacteriaceae bacterium]
MSKKIRLGILGGGGNSLVGILHRIAAKMHDKYDIVGGVFSRDWDSNIEFANEIGISSRRVYADYEIMIKEELKLPQDQRMQAVSILTPNFLHYSMAKRLLENNFSVICEKPLTTTYEEAKELRSLVDKSGLIFAVTYTYTGYPMIRKMREMISQDAIGEVQKVDAQYYQGWINPIIHSSETRMDTWRLDPKKSGVSCCIGDIGTHAFDMLEYLTQLTIDKVLADLNYLYDDNKMDIDGSILIRCTNGVKGIIRASQIATGENNNFAVMIYGKKGGLKWEQENPRVLYFMQEGKEVQILKSENIDTDLLTEDAKLPPGHPDEIFDAMANIYKGAAKAINHQEYDPGEFPAIIDGVRGMNFIESVVESHKKGNVWITIDNK